MGQAAQADGGDDYPEVTAWLGLVSMILMALVVAVAVAGLILLLLAS